MGAKRWRAFLNDNSILARIDKSRRSGDTLGVRIRQFKMQVLSHGPASGLSKAPVCVMFPSDRARALSLRISIALLFGKYFIVALPQGRMSAH